MLLVYYTTTTGNTEYFINKVGLRSQKMPLSGNLEINEPYILVFPSYGGGKLKGIVPAGVKNFLNIPCNAKYLRGVIGSGDRNYGDYFALGSKIVAEKFNVPLLYRYEIKGTEKDYINVRNGVINFGNESRD